MRIDLEQAPGMSDHAPLIVIELVLVFGGALAFAWWQFRDLDREKRKKEQREAQQRLRERGEPHSEKADGHAS
jgi:hypothetical protein